MLYKLQTAQGHLLSLLQFVSVLIWPSGRWVSAHPIVQPKASVEKIQYDELGRPIVGARNDNVFQQLEIA